MPLIVTLFIDRSTIELADNPWSVPCHQVPRVKDLYARSKVDFREKAKKVVCKLGWSF